MSIQIHNSLTKQKEELIPLDGKTIKMYSCGVTVYDKCHIGHARSLYIFDVIRRYLVHRHYKVALVRNITDVDDKIINKANQLHKTFEEVVDENISAYKNDLANLGLSEADIEPRATENIQEMIAHITSLIDKEFAYEVEGDVYYDVRKFKEYGKLSGQSIEHMKDNVRLEEDTKKRDPLDFALWKKAKDNEPSWESPWGQGRPGWHIECSCMSMKYLDTPTLDIHAGGRDLIFPHHENEIAQSEALTGKPFAKYWIHHGLLTINGQKMAKSLGNFITVDDALKKYSVEQLKFFYLSSHYASPIDFTDEKLVESKKALGKFENLEIRLNKIDSQGEKEDKTMAEKYVNEFHKVMDDDFNTPRALAVLFDFLTESNTLLDKSEKISAVRYCFGEIINILKQVFTITFDQEKGEIDQDVKDVLKKRQEARNNKQYDLSDQLRDQLKTMGYIVEDSKEGQTLKKI